MADEQVSERQWVASLLRPRARDPKGFAATRTSRTAASVPAKSHQSLLLHRGRIRQVDGQPGHHQEALRQRARLPPYTAGPDALDYDMGADLLHRREAEILFGLARRGQASASDHRARGQRRGRAHQGRVAPAGGKASPGIGRRRRRGGEAGPYRLVHTDGVAETP